MDLSVTVLPTCRLYILGAGFSRAAGLPLGSELIDMVLHEARRTDPDLYQNVLRRDLNEYRRYQAECDGIPEVDVVVDYEQFLAYLDMEHHLRLSGSDTWSFHNGNLSQMAIKNLIARILWRAQQNMTPDQWQIYIEFASVLGPHDTVISFNYDTILEEAFTRAGRRFRRFPRRLRRHGGLWAVDSAGDSEILLLKLHGSIDWFDDSSYRSLQDDLEDHGQSRDASPNASIFGCPSTYDLSPLIEGEYPLDSYLRKIYQCSNLSAYMHRALHSDSPLILAPSTTKYIYANPLVDLWNGLADLGAFNGRLAIIGYSLPAHDSHSRQLLYWILRRFQRYDPGIEDWSKRPLLVVDKWCSDAEKEMYRSRYRFVDWNAVDVHDSGFGRDVLGLLQQ